MNARAAHAVRPAFTLVEMLVVIAVISLLMAILMPALANARKVARMTREMAHAEQMTQTYLAYTSDFRERFVPAHANWGIIRSGCPAGPKFQMTCADPFNRGTSIDGGIAKAWTFFVHSWGGTPLHAMQIDKDTYDNFMSRPRTGTNSFPGWTDYDDSSALAAFAAHTTLGLNGVYVGGSYRHGGYQGVNGFTNPGLGNFYVTKLSEVVDPSRLTVFSSSRGGDVAGTTFRGWFSQYPDTGVERPGYMLVTPPNGPTTGTSPCRNWMTVNYNTPARYDPRKVPSTWGNIAFRHFDQSVVSSMDGHVQMRTIEELRDMRLWSNYADSANWTFRGR